MTPEEFVDKWRASTRTERSASQEHFLDLCKLLDLPLPGAVDPHGAEFTFEKSVLKLDGRPGRADVWKKGCFAWEYKGDRRNLVAAYSQLKEYADALEHPPLLVVSDMKEIRVHTNFTNSVVEQTAFILGDLYNPQVRQKLRWIFTDPEKWRPGITREGVTTKAAAAFAKIAQGLRAKEYEPRRVAHFLNKLVFCLFVEDIELLPDRIFADIVEESAKRPADFVPMLGDLFRAMRDRNGRFGTVAIPWFNGGLFDDDDVLPLTYVEITSLLVASRLDWSAIEPSIFGTLFERGLDPEKRKEMAGLFDAAEAPSAPAPKPLPGLLESRAADKGVGIHYTDPGTIMKIIEPVVLKPLRAEWEAVKAEIRKKRQAKAKAASAAARTKAETAARELYFKFRDRLGKFRVLDPACGSGNFLYLALFHLKNFDREVMREATNLELPLDDQRVGPEAVLGIEINPYAAELARVTIWIGELQWQLRNAFAISRRPILGSLKGIVHRDALLNADGTEAKWPEADAVIGNPPFLGGKLLISKLGSDYTASLRNAYAGRLPGFTDLVTYWFEKARAAVQSGVVSNVGLVATNSIAGGSNLPVMERIARDCRIYEAWSDVPWALDGAAVRVAIVCFSRLDSDHPLRLDGRQVDRINPNLSADSFDLTKAVQLAENRSVCFEGGQKHGPFEIDGDTARAWLVEPLNPNGRSNSDVICRFLNATDVVRRMSDSWVIDFGASMSEADAALYEKPFSHVQRIVRPIREKSSLDMHRRFWWRHHRTRPELRKALMGLSRFMVTPVIAKHRVFVWLPLTYWPTNLVDAIARDDDTTFGILHSKFHELWALRMGTSLEDRPRYTPSTTFETFPFPEGLTPALASKDYAKDPRAQRIAAAAKRLDELRQNWLNPADLVRREPEVVPGYPERILPANAAAAKVLAKRTLTNLYNERPAWLANAHRDLDAAVAAAYGWPADLDDDDILKRLFELNQERAARQTAR